jgi:TM2 domain-containing membrane protein YozV
MHVNGIAAVLSFLIPGLGQMLMGRVIRGLLWFFATLIGYALFIAPGLCLHLLCIICAASIKNGINGKVDKA